MLCYFWMCYIKILSPNTASQYGRTNDLSGSRSQLGELLSLIKPRIGLYWEKGFSLLCVIENNDASLNEFTKLGHQADYADFFYTNPYTKSIQNINKIVVLNSIWVSGFALKKNLRFFTPIFQAGPYFPKAVGSQNHTFVFLNLFNCVSRPQFFRQDPILKQLLGPRTPF